MSVDIEVGKQHLSIAEQAKLLDLAHDTIMVRQLDGTITYWNHGAEQMYGYGKVDALGRASHELLSTVFPAPLAELTRTLLATGYWEGELTHTRRDGAAVVVDSRWVLERHSEGAPLRVLEINNEITARKKVEAERDQQTAMLQERALLLDLALDAIVVRSLDGTIAFWNRGAERMYGYEKNEAIGRTSHSLLDTIFPAPIEDIQETLLKSGSWDGELHHIRRDGASIVVASRWALQRDGSGAPCAVMELNTDITARKRLEEEDARRQEIIRAQQLAIAQLSTPLIPITDTVLVMPIIGVLDSSRAVQIMQTLLEGISSSRGEVAIVDITGVPVVDTQVANALIQAARAVRLLGAEVVLTGIRPEVAHTLVGLGADLSSVTTCGTLQRGIAYALGTMK
jgi:rsbT co-antagonist protein RsbR